MSVLRALVLIIKKKGAGRDAWACDRPLGDRKFGVG